MTWTVSSLVIQVVAGIIGGNVAALAAHEHRFGIVGHTVAGLVGGFLSGAFLQTLVNTIVDGAGVQSEPQPGDIFVLQALAGLVCGAAAMLAVVIIKHGLGHHNAPKD